MSSLDRLMDPTLLVATEAFDAFITYFQEAGYSFVSPNEVLGGLTPGGRYVMATFDDGYRNNSYVLPVIRRHGVPITLFVATNYVAEQRAFWWDVVYRERSRRGTPHAEIVREQSHLKTFTHERISEYLLADFGSRALNPIEEDDRPMTVSEVQDFAANPLVHIGNHTADHAVLTGYGIDAVYEQIEKAQCALEDWTGVRPIAIAYPNGNYSEAIEAKSREAGICLGLTLDARRNAPVSGERELMHLGRFLMPRAVVDGLQYTSHRSPLALRRGVNGLVHRIRR